MFCEKKDGYFHPAGGGIRFQVRDQVSPVI